MIRVKLQDSDKRQCLAWAKQVAEVCKKHGRTYSSFDKKVSVERHYLGYLGELSLAKALNLKHNVQIFNGPDQLDNKANQLPDIEPDIEVRTIDNLNFSLIVRPRDLGRYRFVLMYYDKATGWARALGWFYGYQAKVPAYRKEGKHGLPAFYVPQKDLNSMLTLEVISV